MHPPSMVSSEVDSSSTARTYEELTTSVNQKRQPATEIPVERADQSESVRHEPLHVEEKHAQQNLGQPSEERAERPQQTAAGAFEEESISASSKSTKFALNALLGKRLARLRLYQRPRQRQSQPAIRKTSVLL